MFFSTACVYFVHIYGAYVRLIVSQKMLAIVGHMSYRHLTCVTDACGVHCRLARCLQVRGPLMLYMRVCLFYTCASP